MIFSKNQKLSALLVSENNFFQIFYSFKSKTLNSETDELSIKNIELYDTVFYMDIEDIIPMQNSTKIVTEN